MTRARSRRGWLTHTWTSWRESGATWGTPRAPPDDRLKLLYIAPYPPNLTRVRTLHLVRELAQICELQLYVMSVRGERPDVSAVQADLTEAIPAWKMGVNGLRGYSRGLPLQAAMTSAHELATALSRGSWDWIHAEHLRSGSALLGGEHAFSWDAVDAVSALLDSAAAAAGGLRGALLRREAKRTRQYEKSMLSAATLTFAAGEFDAGLLRAIQPGASVRVVANGVDLQRFAFSGSRRPSTVVFSGKMSFHANVHAARILLKEVMPMVWLRRPSVDVVVAGANPPRSLQKFGTDERVRFTGYVEDIGAVISNAAVAFCCIPYGQGIQNKVLEAMAVGTPVVANAVATRSLQVVGGEHLLVADSPQAAADAILEIMDDRELNRRISAQARTYVEDNHTWAAAARRMASQIDLLAQTGTVPRSVGRQ